MALAYSPAEYLPIFGSGPTTQHVDSQLDTTCKLEQYTGTICSTPLPCLHVLSSIAKPHIWFSAFTQRMLQKVEEFPHLPIQDIINLPSAQLQSDALSVGTPHQLTSPPNQPGNKRWASKEVPSKHRVSDLILTIQVPRRQWSTLNRTSFRSRCSLFFANLSQMGQQP